MLFEKDSFDVVRKDSFHPLRVSRFLRRRIIYIIYILYYNYIVIYIYCAFLKKSEMPIFPLFCLFFSLAKNVILLVFKFLSSSLIPILTFLPCGFAKL
ncbi:membrane protein [gut metagenome]|uniref:Membrane protein n=1 Tax=gut metagenome TaxID=749906 RepID=J9GI41_9ZZZZ